MKPASPPSTPLWRGLGGVTMFPLFPKLFALWKHPKLLLLKPYSLEIDNCFQFPKVFKKK